MFGMPVNKQYIDFMVFQRYLIVSLFVLVAFSSNLKMTITAEDVYGNATSDSIVLEVGGGFYDGWKYGEDEYDLPSPPTNDYIDLFFLNNWIGEVDVLDNVCEANQFYSDRKGWSDNNFSKLWDVAGFVVGDVDSLKLLIDIENVSEAISVYLLTPTKTLNLLSESELVMNKEDLQAYVSGSDLVAPVQILVTNCGGYYCTDIDSSGEAQLIVFSDTIEGLEPGDEIGVFDLQGITNYNDCTNQLGEILVGSMIWDGDANSQGTVGTVSAIGSVDLCALGGVQLPGYIEGNSLLIRVWKPSTQTEYLTDVTYSTGSGVFGDIITAVSKIEMKGCVDESACNYDQGATIDDGSCFFNAEGYDCNGDCIGYDCTGVCGGLAYADLCGVCNDNTLDDEDTCEQDCLGEWNGTATEDDCGVCDNYETNDNTTCSKDCLGIWGGSAEYDCSGVCQGSLEVDECGVCGGSGPLENFDCNGNCLIEADCSGQCGGDLILDDCGVCGGSGPLEECGCDSILEGFCDCEGNVFDDCGVCGGPGVLEGFCDCNGSIEDCAGQCGGEAQLDNCGICQGDNSTCIQDCLGVWGGDAILDNCGVCEGGNTTCEQDCLGVWGGDAVNDCFSDCNGFAQYDCKGVCGGFAENDDCDVCDDNPNNDNQTCADTGEDSGNSFISEQIPYNSYIAGLYPNPFNPSVSIDYYISNYQEVSIFILDVRGREVEEIVMGYKNIGRHKILWYPKKSLSSGVYLVVLKTDDSVQTQKITFIR